MPGDHRGPLERAWRECGFAVRTIAGLSRPRLLIRRGCVPCAFMPEGPTGLEREALFAWLILDLERRRDGWSELVARLRTYYR